VPRRTECDWGYSLLRLPSTAPGVVAATGAWQDCRSIISTPKKTMLGNPLVFLARHP
jgi:hypothetical protein